MLRVLRQFGFAEKFISWIDTILHSARLSIAVNGVPYGYFPSSRGVHQGDPLSLLLFCIVEDVLSRGITHLVGEGRVWSMSSPHNCRAPTHMVYADDIMVFCQGNFSSLTNLMNLFQEYDTCSSHIVNRPKSQVFIGKGAQNRSL